MRAYSNVVLLVLLLFIHSSQLFFCQNSTSGCIERERQALLKFRASFRDRSLGPLGSWEGNNCCQWKGVGCDGISGHITRLDLGPPRPQLDAKDVNPSLLELEHLSYLDLSGNNFNSNPIPKFLGSMKQLRYLNLTYCNFFGRIPHHLGNLSNLFVLDVSYNVLDLHDDDMGWVPKLSSLKHIAMNGVSLEKTYNLFQVLYMLPSLLQAEFSSCRITNIHITHAPVNSTFLANVEVLDLAFNAFQDSIPNAFQNMTSVRDLDLSGNSLSSFPNWVGNLHSLVHLDLSWNSFNKSEVSIVSILKNTCSLQSLDLSYYMYGSELSSVSFGSGNLSGCMKYDLEELLLRQSGISDKLPNWLGELKNLRKLDLSNNLLRGQIPASLGRLSSLVELDFSNNQLNGTIPSNFGQLANLSTLKISNNSLQGTFSEIHLENLSNLFELQLGFNKLSVKINSNWTAPFQFLMNLGMASCNIGPEFPQWLRKQKRLVTLDLSNNSIGGPIPNWTQEMNRMEQLDLSNNLINGSIPKKFGDNSRNLSHLILKRNLIEGLIPSSLCKMEWLYVLDLSNNRLSGKIPNCWRDLHVLIINLSSNNLSGTIPSSFGNFYRVAWLNLSNNSLQGEPLHALKSIQEIEILDLGGNQFFGAIPSWIGLSLQELQVLRLSQNFLSGDIPLSLCQLSFLQVLDLAGNNLSGSIPPCIFQLRGMIKLSDFSLPATGITTNDDQWGKQGTKQVLKGLQLDYTSNLKYLVNIDLFNNSLVGLIPEGLTYLSGLIGLNLSHNKFSGKIPSKIGDMKSLESIDLSSNQLFGPIPTNMTTLTSLSHLNLSNNNFSGLIPQGGQFSTFDSSSYGRNRYLCGYPQTNVCLADGVTQPLTRIGYEDKSGKDEEKEKVLFYFVIALGFITGFWGVIGILSFKRKWRHVCFQYVDNFVDLMYVEIMIRIARLEKSG